MTSRKKPGVSFWATVVVVVGVVLLVSYPLAYGPWIGYGDELPKPINVALGTAFEPIGVLYRNGHAPEVYERYLDRWFTVFVERLAKRSAEEDNGDLYSGGPHRTPRIRSRDAARR